MAYSLRSCINSRTVKKNKYVSDKKGNIFTYVILISKMSVGKKGEALL